MVVVAAACYQPAAQEGAPCSPGGACPAGLACDRSMSPPICVGPGGGGDPVECVDDAQCRIDAPVCGANGTCRRCAADAECAPGVCRELTGRCVAEAEVLFVSPAGTDFGGSCTRSQPCATIGRALALVTAARRTIRVGDGAYPDRVDVKNADGSALPIVLSGEDADPAGAELGNGGTEGLSTEGNVTVEVEGLRISNTPNSGVISRGDATLYRVAVLNANGHGIDVRSGDIRILECSVSGSKNRGISVSGADADIQRALITGNKGGGIEVFGSAFTLINTIVGDNGSAMSSIGGLTMAGNATVKAFRFNTITHNAVSAGSSNHPGVQCNAPVVIESSILADNSSNDVISEMCVARYSLFGADPPVGEGNVVGAPAFVSATDFHITPASPARDRADPAATEDRDVDNQARSDGRRDIGADELQP
jgi:hypothetical protein